MNLRNKVFCLKSSSNSEEIKLLFEILETKNENYLRRLPKWTRKDLYFGPSYEELQNGKYIPVPMQIADSTVNEVKCSLLYRASLESTNAEESSAECKQFTRYKKSILNEWRSKSELKQNLSISKLENLYRDDPHIDCSCSCCNLTQRTCQLTPDKDTDSNLPVKLSRIGFGINENCEFALALSPQITRPKSRSYHSERSHLLQLAENGVRRWETSAENKYGRLARRERLGRHPRIYGLSTAAYFLQGFGPWPVAKGERESIRVGRSSSLVCLRRQPREPELRLSISRKQLSGSVSCTALDHSKPNITSYDVSRSRVILFWTPEYWYRPRAATVAYKQLRRHLDSLRAFREVNNYKKNSLTRDRSLKESLTRAKSSNLLKFIFPSRKRDCTDTNGVKDDALSRLKDSLRLESRMSVWDIDSTTIAQQLTLIDRDLFIRIPSYEVEILICERSTRNTPNLAGWIAFGHRISCLISSEILSVKKVRPRSRLISRFIDAARRCFEIGNFQSCRSILAGFQSPAIYRLKVTWSCVRVRHATRYAEVEKLCKIFKSPLTKRYRVAWYKAVSNPPCLPYVGDLINRIFSPFRAETTRETAIILDRRNSIRFPERSSVNLTEQSVGSSQNRRLSRFNFLVAPFSNVKRKKSSNATVKSRNSRERYLARKYANLWKCEVARRKILFSDQASWENDNPETKRTIEICSWLIDCQRFARIYNHAKHLMAWEFLLKARYKEERENFFYSFTIEPARTQANK